MIKKSRRRIAAMGGIVLNTVFLTSTVSAQSVASSYLQYVRNSINELSVELPHIIRVADSSAARLVKSEALVHISAQPNFTSELRGRAAGLGLSTQGGSDESKHPDTLFLLGYAPETESRDDRVGLASTIINGYTVLFAAPEQLGRVSSRGRYRFGPEKFDAVIDNLTGKHAPFEAAGRQVSTSSLLNIVNGWLFVGELTSACTRLGRMPVFYLSFAIDQRNNYERAGKYSRELSPGLPYGSMKAFHDDVVVGRDAEAAEDKMVVPPLEPGRLAGEYIGLIDAYLADYSGPRLPELEKIVDRAVEVTHAGGTVFFTAIGHTFPAEVPEKDRLSGAIRVIAQNWDSDDYSGPGPGPADLMIVFGMPTYPASRAEFAREHGLNLVLLSSEAPTDRGPEEYETDRYLWLRTPWPLEDGAVEIPGYDIKVLPVSGVMNIALYHAVRLELESRLGI